MNKELTHENCSKAVKDNELRYLVPILFSL